MMELIVGFISGIGVSLVSAIVASALARRRDKRKTLEDNRFQIYMKLLDLHADYFWFATSELHGEEVRPEIRARCRSQSWQILDLLRATDDLPYLDEIVDVLLGDRFASAQERHDSMDRLLGKLGNDVNPTYQRRIAEVSKEKLLRLASGEKSNAPGSTHPI